MNKANRSSIVNMKKTNSMIKNSNEVVKSDQENDYEVDYDEVFDSSVDKSNQMINVVENKGKDGVKEMFGERNKSPRGSKQEDVNLKGKDGSGKEKNTNEIAKGKDERSNKQTTENRKSTTRISSSSNNKVSPPSKDNNFNQGRKSNTSLVSINEEEEKKKSKINEEKKKSSNNEAKSPNSQEVKSPKINHEDNKLINSSVNQQPSSRNKHDSDKENHNNESYHQQYDDYEQEEDEQPQIIQNQQPQQQSFTLLSNKQILPVSNTNSLQATAKQNQKTQRKQLSREQMSHQIYQNQKLIKQLKQKTAHYRQQIKNISNLVDKDIHKTIVKISTNSKQVNLKNIFQEIYNTESPSILKLREQLFTIRSQCKLLKAQISSTEQKLNDPITHQNTLKYQELQTKLKTLNTELNKTKSEKLFAFTQIERMKLGSGLIQFQHFEKSINRNQQTLNKILNQIKDQRTKAYKLEKQDIFFMEKLKFLTQNSQKLQITMNLQKSTQERPTSQDLRQLLSEINSILEQRNNIENDKAKLLKSLNAQIQSMEAKNLALITNVRSLDAALLQFYTNKIQKKHSINKGPKTAQKLHETIDSGSPILREKNNQTQIINDKNSTEKSMGISSSSNKFRSKMQVKKNPTQQKGKDQVSPANDFLDLKVDINLKDRLQIKLEVNKDQKTKRQQTQIEKSVDKPVEKEVYHEVKHALNFGDLRVDEKGAILSDQILGRVQIREMTFFVDKKNLYGVQCKYFNKQKPQIFGMKICQKNADQKCQKITLTIDTKQKQKISSIKMGYSLRNDIKMIEINTSLGKSLKWSVDSEVSRVEEKVIQRYSTFCIKAKLISSDDVPSVNKSLNELMIDRPKLKLAGLGFSLSELIKGSSSK